jgi:hypothetical protein
MKITRFIPTTLSLALAVATLWGASATVTASIAADIPVTTAAASTTHPTFLPSRFTASRAVDGSLTLSLIPASLDEGTQKAIFIIAFLNNDVYVRTRTGWTLWTDDWRKIPSIDGDATTGAVPRHLGTLNELVCTACTDKLSGIRLYMGYGTNIVDMLNQYTYNEVVR